jgi:hypothetical protein
VHRGCPKLLDVSITGNMLPINNIIVTASMFSKVVSISLEKVRRFRVIACSGLVKIEVDCPELQELTITDCKDLRVMPKVVNRTLRVIL